MLLTFFLNLRKVQANELVYFMAGNNPCQFYHLYIKGYLRLLSFEKKNSQII
jgi:hypothetical protein